MPSLRLLQCVALLSGEAGVRRAMRIFSADTSTDMAMLGIRSLSQLARAHVRRAAALHGTYLTG